MRCLLGLILSNSKIFRKFVLGLRDQTLITPTVFAVGIVSR
jgi:hypothetical protein